MSRPIASESVFQAIAHPTRRRIIDQLFSGDQTVCAMRDFTGTTLQTLSQHLRVLRHVGLVSQRRRGRYRMYTLNVRLLDVPSSWLSRFHRARSKRKQR